MPVSRLVVLYASASMTVGPVFAQQPPPPPVTSLPPMVRPSPQLAAPASNVGMLDLGAVVVPASPPTSLHDGVATRATQPGGAHDPKAASAKVSTRPPKTGGPDGHVEHVLFDRRPVPILLTPGRERLVQFPFVPLIDVPPALQGRLEVQIIEDTAYLTAASPFPRTRFVAHALDGGTKLPLDVESVDSYDAAGVLQIHLPQAANDDEWSADAAGGQAAAPLGMVELTRYAAQVLYAPRRLIPTLPGVRQEPVERVPVVGLYRGNEVETAPLGAWSAGSLHVTAIRFTNRTERALELDMERLRGAWLAATPQHWRLLPQGSEADTTAVYLVSDRPYATVQLWR